MKSAIGFFLMIVLTSTCSGLSNNDLEKLQETNWLLAEISNSKELPEEQRYEIRFGEDQKFTSRVDCNVVTGNYEVKRNSRININPEVSTYADCGTESMSENFISLLYSVSTYHISSNALVLVADEDGEQAMTFIIDS